MIIWVQIVNLGYISTKDNQLISKCIEVSKSHKDLIKKFENTYEFCDGDINKFILLLRKIVYPYECMDNWERFDEELLPNKEGFYSSLKMEDITDVAYRHAEKVFKNFNNKNLGDYHDLYVQSDTLLLADIFEKFRNKFSEIYEPDPAYFPSAPGVIMESMCKKTDRITNSYWYVVNGSKRN